MEKLSEIIKKKRLVVVDLETTGLNYDPCVGAVDYIIEVGAVKIEKGKITEKFHSFVACPVALPNVITELTGITDKMLVGARSVGDVLLDLQAFCKDCCFVGHNVGFDLHFLRYYGKSVGADFAAKAYDTVEISKTLLKGEIPNAKLPTVAKYFGIPFQGHRALDDALTTAKIFLNCAKLQAFFDWLRCMKEFD